jgi:hypothetical protein
LFGCSDLKDGGSYMSKGNHRQTIQKVAALTTLIQAGFALTAFASSGGDTIKELTNNSWAYLNPTPSQRYIPVPMQPDAEQELITSAEPSFREYTGIVYGDGKIFYFGGAHGGYPGNDVEIYDIENNLWTQSYKPEVPPADDPVYGSGGSPNVSPTGKPYTIHGYARTSYNPQLKRYVCTANNSVATYDPASNSWSFIAGQFAPNGEPPLPDWGSADQISQWDGGLRGLLFTGMYSWRGVWLFKDGAFSFIGDNGTPLSVSGGAASIYIPDEQVHLFAVLPTGGDPADGHLYLYDAASNMTKEINSVPSSLRSQFYPEGNFVMAYDGLNKKVIGLSPMNKNVDGAPSPIQVWSYDVASDGWEELPLSDSSPKTSGWHAGTGRSIFQYDPIHNIFILVIPKGGHWANGVETWAYRYKMLPASPIKKGE